MSKREITIFKLKQLQALVTTDILLVKWKVKITCYNHNGDGMLLEFCLLTCV